MTAELVHADLGTAIDRAVDGLFTTQRANGSWRDELPSSAVSTGAAVAALHVSGADAEVATAACTWLRDTQNDDGSWGDYPGGPGTLNATAIATAALAMADPQRSAVAVAAGARMISEAGGETALEDRRVCTLSALCRTYLADADLYDAGRLGRMPLELILLPRSLRQKLSFTFPALLAFGLRQAHTWRFGPIRRQLNKVASRRAETWLRDLQDFAGPDGGYEESPLLVSIVWYGLARAGVGADISARCREYLLATRRADGSWSINRDLEFSTSMFLVQGLLAAGLGDDPRLAATREWILDTQLGPLFATGCPPGGWGWSRPSGWPDTDDTASALMVLPGLGLAAEHPAIQAGIAWLRSMQGGNGSWGLLVKGGRLSMDAPCPTFTAHALVGLGIVGVPATDPGVVRGLRHLARVQQDDGAIPALWYRSRVSGTAAALRAYAIHGRLDHSAAQRCRQWLERAQQPDGSWTGSDDWGGTCEDTAWAMLGLLAAGAPASDERLNRAAAWLMDRQQPGGDWPPAPVGVYFSALSYHDNHIATGYALQALGELRARAVDQP